MGWCYVCRCCDAPPRRPLRTCAPKTAHPRTHCPGGRRRRPCALAGTSTRVNSGCAEPRAALRSEAVDELPVTRKRQSVTAAATRRQDQRQILAHDSRCACKTRRARACFSFASQRRNSRKPIYLSQILAPLSGWSQQNKQNAKQPSGKKPACFISFDSGRRLARTEEKSPFPLLVLTILTNQLSKTDQLSPNVGLSVTIHRH